MDITDFVGNATDVQSDRNVSDSCHFCQCANSSEVNNNYCTQMKECEAKLTPILHQSFKQCHHFPTGKVNEIDISNHFISEKLDVSLLHIIGNFINKNEDLLFDSPNVLHSFGENTELEFIDDQTEEGTDHNLDPKYIHSENISMHKFTLNNNIIAEHVNESILEDSYQDNQREHDINYFIFSTTSSRRPHSPITWEKIYGDDYCEDFQENHKLDCDISLIEDSTHHDSILPSVLEHRCSTPKKHKISNPKNISYVHSESDEDIDIEESYLDTIWISKKATNLPGCSLFIKCLKNYQESQLAQSMICKLEETDVPVEMFSNYSFQGTRNELDICSTKEFPSRIYGPMINNTADASIQSVCKMSYKDKLMEGLHLNPITSNTNFWKDDEMPSIDKKNLLMNCASANDLRDLNHNVISKKSIEEHSNSCAQNLINTNQGPWCEQKLKKNGTKRTRNSSTSAPKTGQLRASESEKYNTSKFQTKREIISKESNGVMNPPAEVSELYKVKQTENSLATNILEEKKAHEEKNIKRRSRKLKKLCSLDLSEYQGNTDANNTMNNPKWKSQDDPENSKPSSLKTDSYLLWPLVGLAAVFAGFVAFCFRDKISFMIASKFPYERPPI